MNEDDITWRKILPEPFVLLELGARGEGKTALGHRLLEVFGQNGRDAYIMGFPESKSDLLPEWVETLPPTATMEGWPEDSIVLIHEAHHLLHARRSMNAENLEIDKLVTVSRHKNSDIVYDTQQSHRLDKNAVAAVDGICVRWPALMQEKFERRQVRPIIKDARDTLSKYVAVHDDNDFTFVERREDEDGVDLLKKHVYVHADQFRGEYPDEIGLPNHWSEEISKAYGDIMSPDNDAPDRDVKSLGEIERDMADPDSVSEKSVSEVDALLEEAGVEPDDMGEKEAEEEADWDDEQAREWMERMIDAGNQVIGNQYPEPIVEIVVPRSNIGELEAAKDEWDINPAGAKTNPQIASFHDERPDIGEGVRGLQFYLEDREELRSAGFDIQKILEELDSMYMVTKANIVDANVPTP